MNERRKTIWAFRRTRLLDGVMGLITVPESVARIAVDRGFASATYNAHPLDAPNAPYADDDGERATQGPGIDAPPVKRGPGRPRKNPAN